MTFQSSCIENNNLQTTFYTGLPLFELFRMLSATLQPLTNRPFVPKCPPENQLHAFLVMSKLRLGVSNRDLVHTMHSVEPFVSTIFHNWIDLMNYEVKQLLIWLYLIFSKDDFQGQFTLLIALKFLSRGHLDFTLELQHIVCRTITPQFNYSPDRIMSFISKAWGGGVSDGHITQH